MWDGGTGEPSMLPNPDPTQRYGLRTSTKEMSHVRPVSGSAQRTLQTRSFNASASNVLFSLNTGLDCFETRVGGERCCCGWVCLGVGELWWCELDFGSTINWLVDLYIYGLIDCPSVCEQDLVSSWISWPPIWTRPTSTGAPRRKRWTFAMSDQVDNQQCMTTQDTFIQSFVRSFIRWLIDWLIVWFMHRWCW